MNRTVVLDVVGLTPSQLGPDTPRLSRFAERGTLRPLQTITPAVTCSVQSTFVTGALPRAHGCVANGWYFRDLAQVWLWRQANALVGGNKLWDLARARDDRFRCAKLFWWYNMYADVDWAVTPRPIYRANGRKHPDVHTSPVELRERLDGELGTFPLFNFWGPNANITSSQWIGDCAARMETWHQPTLSLVYLPHLDYALQKYGPGAPESKAALREIDTLCGELIEHFEAAGLRIIVLSEYGITPVTGPVHINRALRKAGLLGWREEMGEEHFDAGASRAFAVADHQIAHVYVRDSGQIAEVKTLLEGLDGVDEVLDRESMAAYGLDHPRSGELVALSKPGRWFSYYYWLDDTRAPDYARTVDIHRKPGYDPAELFLDPKLRMPMVNIGAYLLRTKVLNQRALLDVIPLDGSLVRGSHGRVTAREEDGPLFMTNAPEQLCDAEGALLGDSQSLPATAVQGVIMRHLFD